MVHLIAFQDDLRQYYCSNILSLSPLYLSITMISNVYISCTLILIIQSPKSYSSGPNFAS